MQTTKDLLAARKETLVRMLSEAARKGASLVMRGYYARAARVGEDMEPLEKELEEVERKITEAAGRKKTVNGGSLERVGRREWKREAQMRSEWEKWWEEAQRTHTDQWSCKMAFIAGFEAGASPARKKAPTALSSAATGREGGSNV